MRLGCVLGVLLAALPAIVRAELKPPPVAQDIFHKARVWRSSNNTMLWSGTYPYYKDPLQNVVIDCWLPAATAAVAWVNPDFIARLFFFPDGRPMRGFYQPASEEAIVTLWNPHTELPQNFTVNAYNKSLTEDGGMNGTWWHSAVTQGFMQMGAYADILGIAPNGTLVGKAGLPEVAMSMLTGKHFTATTKTEYKDMDAWWADMQHCKTTPIVLSTVNGKDIVPSEPSFKPNHAYVVILCQEEPPGNRTMMLRNPWGQQDWFKVQDVWNNIYFTNHIPGFEQLDWDEGSSRGALMDG